MTEDRVVEIDLWNANYDCKEDKEYKKHKDCYGNNIKYICPECGCTESFDGECSYCGRDLEMR